MSVADLPGVGANLQDHPIALSIWDGVGPYSFRPQAAARPAGAGRAAMEIVRHRFRHRQPAVVQAFIRSDPAEARPDIQFQISHTSFLARPWFPGWRKGAGHQFTAGALLLDPESRGRVSLRSPTRRIRQRILLNFLEAERDPRQAARHDPFRAPLLATAPASDLWSPARSGRGRRRRATRRSTPGTGRW
jgi:choline dehydrogenase